MSNSQETAKRKGPSPLVLTIAAVIALLALYVVFAQIYTDVLWFSQVDYLAVFTTEWITRIALFAAGLIVMGFAVFLPLSLAYRKRPVYVPQTPQQENLDRYREAIEPLRRLMTIVMPLVIGGIGGVSLSGAWKEVLLFLNPTSFGKADPEFGLDISFYVFSLPMLRVIGDFLAMAALLSLVAAAVAHYLFGGIRPGEEKGIQLTKAARVQLAVTAAILVLLQAGRIFLQRYTRLMDESGLMAGASYTAVNITIPALLIIAIAAVVVAVLLAANAFRDMWKLSVVSVVMLLVLGAVSIIGLPAAVQQFMVQPSEQSLEKDYLQRNIDATRDAYGIADVEVQQYKPSTEGERGALRADADTAASIRLLDPNLVSDTFRQLQQQRSFYSFPEQLDVDRYEIDGKQQDTVISVRELNPESQATASWLNQSVVYTHGFGVVAAYGNKQGADGRPAFLEHNIPPTGELGEYEPRVYFGEQSPTYSIVGGPEDGEKREIDYPTDDDKDGGAQVYTTFQGDGGPNVGKLFNRLAFAVKFQDEQIVLSDAVNPESQILFNRKPRERVKKVAPFLEVDGDPYPTVVDGRIKWIVDAYTTSSNYPYSTPQVLQAVTEDSNTQRQGAVAALPPQKVNYIRNSVKVAVDAYDGSIDMYAWDEEDPVLQSWSKIFPNALKPISEISGDLMSHVRYPEDLFKVQRQLLTQYHVPDANSFYTKQDFWTTPLDPTVARDKQLMQPPYYMTLQMPGQEKPTFSLTSSFIPRPIEGQTRNNLTGYFAASGDAGNEKGKVADEYGRLRLLQLPRNTTVPGPGQAQNNFNTEPAIQQNLNLLRQGESKVENGNLLTLPIGGGLLYVQPVYVRSQGETSYPVLQRVLVAFGEQIGFAPTLDEALDQVFGGDSGVSAGDHGQSGQASDDEKGSATADGSKDGDKGKAAGGAGLDEALKEADQAMKDSDKAMKEGNWDEYGKAQDRLRKALEKAMKADGADAGAGQGGDTGADQDGDQD